MSHRIHNLANSLYKSGRCKTKARAYKVAQAILDKEKAEKKQPLSSLLREVGNRATQGGIEVGGHFNGVNREAMRSSAFWRQQEEEEEIRKLNEWKEQESRPYGRGGVVKSTYPRANGNYNPYMPADDYRKLVQFLKDNFHYSQLVAENLIKTELIQNGEFPVKRFEKVNNQQRTSIVNMIAKAGLQIEGYTNLDYKKALEDEKKMINRADVKTVFQTEKGEEGEILLVVERGMNKEVVAVSFAYPHYRKQGFYAGRKSNVFAETNDTEKMLIEMSAVFLSLKTVLNNLMSADILTEDNYNNIMDGYEPFIYEALDYVEIEPMLGTTSGLKDGRKKRISKRKNFNKVK